MITIDDREPDSIINKIKNKKVERLEVGDYIINNLLIERKVPHDFLQYPSSSFKKNRFWRQLERMKNLEGYQSCIIIVSRDRKSSLDYLSKKRKRRNAKIIMFEIIIRSYHIPIIQLKDIDELVRFLEKCDEYSNISLPIPREKNKTDKKFESLTLIDGVNLDISKRLLDHFLTIKNIALADKKELKKVEGIGLKMADNIISFFSE